MAENSKIEWTDHSFNPWIGCQAVSPACDHCYAEDQNKYRQWVEWGAQGSRRRTAESSWKKPLAWNRKAAKLGIRYKVFCASLADVFDNHRSIPQQWRDDLWQLIRDTPNLDWQLLTKRPQNIKQYLPDDWGDGFANVWLGTTVENQEEADRRIPHLLDIPAKVRFLSCEPLLGPVDLETAWHGENALDSECWGDCNWCRKGYPPLHNCLHQTSSWAGKDRSGIDWVICGGESGPNARPMHPDWARSLRDQCEQAGVPFLFKQWGEYEPSVTAEQFQDYVTYEADQDDILNAREKGKIIYISGETLKPEASTVWWENQSFHFHEIDPWLVHRVGKSLAGRMLDGKEHNGMPT